MEIKNEKPSGVIVCSSDEDDGDSEQLIIMFCNNSILSNENLKKFTEQNYHKIQNFSSKR